jgi:hypothetical protein
LFLNVLQFIVLLFYAFLKTADITDYGLIAVIVQRVLQHKGKASNLEQHPTWGGWE